MPPQVNQELQLQYNQFKSKLEQLAIKISELETETDEHKLVLETLKPMNSDRKCFRMIGGALVEKTVGDVQPALETTHQGLIQVLKNLTEDYRKTETELQEWQKKHKVQIVRNN